jgi:hypothetical protein
MKYVDYMFDNFGGKTSFAASYCQNQVMFLMEKKISSSSVDTSVADDEIFLLQWFLLEMVWKSMTLKLFDEGLLGGLF